MEKSSFEKISNKELKALKDELESLKRSLKESQITISNYQELLRENEKEHRLTVRLLCHDIVNPLQIISMSLESMLLKNEENPIIERMKRASDKIENKILEARQSLLQDSKSTPII